MYPPLDEKTVDAAERNVNLANELFHMEEFYKERYVDPSNTSSYPGNLLKQQKVVSRFMTSMTPYDRLLVVHEVGTGKTCGALAIAEANRGSKKEVLFVSPNKHLSRQQNSQLSKCFPELYGKGKNKKLEKLYRWYTHASLAKHLSSIDNATLYNRYSNIIIIVDEAHELITSGVSTAQENDDDSIVKALHDQINELDSLLGDIGKTGASKEKAKIETDKRRIQSELRDLKEGANKSVNKRDQFDRLFNIPACVKVVLLTGTPMTNSASELIPLISLLNDGITPRAPKVGGWDNLAAKDRKEKETELAGVLRGRVSYFKQSMLGTQKVLVQASTPSFTDDEGVQIFSLKSTDDGSVMSELNIASASDTGVLYPSKEKLEQLTESVQERLNYLPVCACIMSDIQTQAYTPHWVTGTFTKQNRPSSAEGLPESEGGRAMEAWLGSAELASLLVVPISPDKFISGTELSKWLKEEGNSTKLTKWFLNPGPYVGAKASIQEYEPPKRRLLRLEYLYQFCPKYTCSISHILDAWNEDSKETKKVFVFNRMVEGGAARTFADLLKTFGYEDYTSTPVIIQGSDRTRKSVPHFPAEGDVKPRFILLTGKTPVSKTEVLKLFNDPRNATGKYIQVVIGSEAIKQGFNILDVQEMHVLAPPWNHSGLDQAIGRILRHESHTEIDKILDKPAKIDIRLFAAIPFYKGPSNKDYLNLEEWENKDPKDTKRQEALLNMNSIDIKKYVDLQNKDRAIKRLERLIKVNAIDCPLFYARNRAPGDLKNTRDCEYEKCDYVCSGMDEDEMSSEVAGYNKDVKNPGLNIGQINYTNYDLLYGKELDLLLTTGIKRAFIDDRLLSISDIEASVSNTIEETFTDIEGKADDDQPRVISNRRVLLSVLTNMINNNALVKNNEGFENYLREEEGMYFLTRSLSSSRNEILIANRPIALVKDNSKDILSLLSNSLSAKMLRDPSKIQDIITLQPLLIQEVMLETAFVRQKRGDMDSDTNTIVESVLSVLRKHLKEGKGDLEGFVWSDLLKSTECFRGVKLEDMKRPIVLSSTWCGDPVSWTTPSYWRDIGKPEADTEDLEKLFVRAATWPLWYLPKAPETERAALEKSLPPIVRDTLADKDPLRGKLTEAMRAGASSRESVLQYKFRAPFIGYGPLPKIGSKDISAESKYMDIRWLYRRGDDSFKDFLVNEGPATKWAKKKEVDTSETAFKERTGIKNPKKSEIMLGLTTLDQQDANRELVQKCISRGVDPRECVVPADKRITGEGRKLRTLPRDQSMVVRNWLDRVEQQLGHPHPTQGDMIKARMYESVLDKATGLYQKSLIGNDSEYNPYWEQGSGTDRHSYVMTKNQIANQLQKYGLWDEIEQTLLMRANTRGIGSSMAAIEEV